MISKSRILRQIIEELSRTLETLAGAARVMHADASDEQNKAEDRFLKTTRWEELSRVGVEARKREALRKCYATYR